MKGTTVESTFGICYVSEMVEASYIVILFIIKLKIIGDTLSPYLTPVLDFIPSRVSLPKS